MGKFLYAYVPDYAAVMERERTDVRGLRVCVRERVWQGDQNTSVQT